MTPGEVFMSPFQRPRISLAALILLTAGCSSGGGGSGAGSGGRDLICSDQSWIGGTVEICDGVLVYRDYVYDDHGAANPAKVPRDSWIGSLSPRAGHQDYPADQLNTADLVKLTLAVDGDDLVVTAEMNTLYTADSTVLALAIDTDNDPATGGGSWIKDGVDFGVTSDGWEVLEVLKDGDPATDIDVKTNTFSKRFPKPAGSSWRLQAVAAQADGTVMNVAFRGTRETIGSAVTGGGTWWEGRQAVVLQEGDISEFGHVVRVSDLRPGFTRQDPIGPGLHQRVYTSRYTLSTDGTVGVDGIPAEYEGISKTPVPGRRDNADSVCGQGFHFFGKYQPYGIYIPDKPGPHGVQFALHGCNANHASLINGIGMQGRFGEDLNRIIVVPLGRGPLGWYSDISERDVLDVLEDVLASYPVDSDRIFAGGYSMGGYGTLRLAALYPQLFAGAVNWVGFTGNVFNSPGDLVGSIPIIGGELQDGGTAGGIGNVIDYTGNLRHIPTASLYAGADELVQVNTGLALMERFADADGVPYEFFFHPAADHLTFAVLDDWAKEAAYSKDFVRVNNPARVTYRTDAWLANETFDLRHDRAYWISGIRGRDGQDAEGSYIDVDLTSHGCGGAIPVLETGSNVGEDPVPWYSEFRARTGEEPLPQSSLLTGTLNNVAELIVNVAGACLSGTVTYDIVSDGPATLRLSNGRGVNLATGQNQGTF
jgi:dienelactone hydrolase